MTMLDLGLIVILGSSEIYIDGITNSLYNENLIIAFMLNCRFLYATCVNLICYMILRWFINYV